MASNNSHINKPQHELPDVLIKYKQGSGTLGIKSERASLRFTLY